MSLSRENEKYIYGDIEKYPENERWELIDGIPYLQGQPSPMHQSCVIQLIIQFGNFLKDKPCEILHETSVWLDLKPGQKRKNSSRYVVPDLLIVCDKTKIQDDGIYGVPDLVIEVLSPSTAGVDAVKKYNQYLSVSLGEYWIVDPSNSLITVFTLKNDDYKSKIYAKKTKIPVGIFNGKIEIDPAEIFALKTAEDDH